MLFNQACSPALSIHDTDTLCQYYITILYDGVQRSKADNLANNPIYETYGEVLYPSVDKLLRAITLTEKDIFIDLGSGMGKIVIQFFLKSMVKAAYGIELKPDLHQLALNAAARLQCDLPEFYIGGRQLTFLSGSFLETPFTTATVALINPACFPQSLLNKLGTILEDTPSIHTVLSLRPISTLRRLVFMKVIRIECSWDSALCYVYGSRAC